MSDNSFLQRALNIHASGVAAALFGCYIAGATRNCCHVGAFCVHHTTIDMSRHFRQSYTRRAHEYLAATCHLHFWQKDRDLLRATAVTRGWNGYRNKTQHRKLSLERIVFLPLLHQSRTRDLSITNPAL